MEKSRLSSIRCQLYFTSERRVRDCFSRTTVKTVRQGSEPIQTFYKKTVQGDLFPFKVKGKLQDSKEGEKEPKHPLKENVLLMSCGTLQKFPESQRQSKKRKHHESPSPERSCKHWSDQRNQGFVAAYTRSCTASPPQIFMPPQSPQQIRLLGGVSGVQIWPNEKIRE